MRDVANAWLVTDISTSPTAVATIQAAATLPIFLLAIPAGVLSDILNRRKFLIFIQVLLAVTSLALTMLAASGLMTIGTLIGLTLLGGTSAALMAPTWQAIVPDLVSRSDLKSAVALNSLGINISRSIGPALGGLLLAALGAAFTYAANVVTYLFVIAALLWWKPPARRDDDLAERTLGAFRAGFRYTRASRPLHRVLLRALIFFTFADTDGLMLAAAIGTAVAMAAVSFGPPRWLAAGLLLVLGVAWIIALTTLNSTAQTILPNWVRGRGLAVYLTIFNGAMTGGSLAWGLVAESLGERATLLISAAGLLAVSLALYRVKLPLGEADLVPSNHWPEPLTAAHVEHDRGPVMILVEYRIPAENRGRFLDAITRLSEARRRDGAYAWGVTEDAANPERVVEWFMIESWAEHLRQHKRVSRADADLQREVASFHAGPESPRVQHLLSLPKRADLHG